MPESLHLRDREFAMLFPATPHGARLARRLADKRLRWWGVAPHTPTLLVAVLATNAVTHCRPGPGHDCFLRLAIQRRALRVEVADSCPDRQPELRKPADDAEYGRGMLLVDALSAAWGVSRRGNGKTVWCELPASLDTPLTP